MNASGRIALGMSGGVDSAVSAALLMRAGYEVVGVTCRFRDNAATERAAADAAAVCSQLGIRHEAPGCVGEFERCVVEPFVSSYAAGPPSPCVGCNAVRDAALVRVADELGSTSHRHGLKLHDEGGGACDRGRSRYSRGREGRKPRHQLLHQGDYRRFCARVAWKAPGTLWIAWGCARLPRGLANYTVGQRKGIGVAGPSRTTWWRSASKPANSWWVCRRDAHRLRRGGRDELAGVPSLGESYGRW
ncbi:MAG: 7-cyano-7-deazaguanine synthase [Eggerthella lenta]